MKTIKKNLISRLNAIILYSLASLIYLISCEEKESVHALSYSDASVQLDRQVQPMNYIPASTEEEFFALIANKNANIIRSKKDFLQRTQITGSVYAKLNSQVVQEFVNALKFKNGGLSTAAYEIIENSLSTADLEVFWEGFGLAEDFVLAADHKNYKCASQGNCVSDTRYICTSNC